MAITLVHDCDVQRRPTPNALNGDFRDCHIEGEPVIGQVSTHDGGLVMIGVRALGGKGSEFEDRGLFRYDLHSFIPAGAVLTGATLYIYISATDCAGDQGFRACRIRRHDWKEDEATWIAYKTGSNWTTPGAGDTTNDRDISTPGYVLLGALTTTGWHALTGSDPYIFDLVDDAWNNRGGICTFIVERYTFLSNEGYVQVAAKPPPPSTPDAPYTHHLRITYTLDGKTFQVMVA